MRLAPPSLAMRLLPLLDIIFILLAFFLILPQGKPEWNPKKAFSSHHQKSPSSLSLTPYFFFQIQENQVILEYWETKAGSLFPRRRIYLAQEFGEDFTLPKSLYTLLEKHISTLWKKGESPQFSIRALPTQGETMRVDFLATSLILFAEANQIPYTYQQEFRP